MTPRDKITSYLSTRVDAFWVDAAMNYIGRVLATNYAFVTEVSGQRLTTDGGRVAKYSANVKVKDANGTETKGRISYSLDPQRPNGKHHQVELKLFPRSA